jgi:hypothetical protein
MTRTTGAFAASIVRLMPFDLSEYDRAFTGFVHDTVNALARAQSPLLNRIAVEDAPGTASSVVDGREAEPLDLPSEPVGSMPPLRPEGGWRLGDEWRSCSRLAASCWSTPKKLVEEQTR